MARFFIVPQRLYEARLSDPGRRRELAFSFHFSVQFQNDKRRPAPVFAIEFIDLLAM